VRSRASQIAGLPARSAIYRYHAANLRNSFEFGISGPLYILKNPRHDAKGCIGMDQHDPSCLSLANMPKPARLVTSSGATVRHWKN
jgi:hypothetical protein